MENWYKMAEFSSVFKLKSIFFQAETKLFLKPNSSFSSSQNQTVWVLQKLELDILGLKLSSSQKQFFKDTSLPNCTARSLENLHVV
jgi:hypothetical protein